VLRRARPFRVLYVHAVDRGKGGSSCFFLFRFSLFLFHMDESLTCEARRGSLDLSYATM
jgi:hypothetical protein